MDICNELTYNDYLLNILDNYTNIDDINNQLKMNIYITLISLSNGFYNEENEHKKIDLIEDFSRKVNNLKVKIQLKRKEEEIDKLLDDIKVIYEENKELIEKYNIIKLDIINIISSKQPKEITKIIDVLTKEKIKRIDNKVMYDNLRNSVINNIFNNNYHIMDNTLYINAENTDDIVISLEIFYEVFDYLLDVYNYPQLFNNVTTNRNHTILVGDIIKFLSNGYIDNINTLIPIALTHTFMKNDINYELDMSKFKIDNIKITDLYKLAEENKELDPSKCAMWRKIIIPNSYLLNRVNEIIKKGTYYFQDDTFIMEDIVNKVSDFKISINKNDILTLVKKELSKMNKETTYSL